jgi:GTP-binding protein
MTLFRNAVFHTTVANLADLPDDSACEVAFAGRSNAGKSSAINALADHTRLAFVSKLPGRTQHLNYFRVGDGKYFVDLPGYGFAKAPAEIRDQWESLLAPYLVGRSPLVGLVLIMDSRHPLTELDWQMLNWFGSTGRPIHVLLSKSDKLTRNEQAKVLGEVQIALATLGELCSVQLFSSLKRSGVEAFEKLLAEWFGLSVDEERPRKTQASRTGRAPMPKKRNVIGWSARVAHKAKPGTAKQKPPVTE